MVKLKVKRLINCFLDKLSNYNIFLPEENPNTNESEQTTVIQHQKYSTRLYILLLICKYSFSNITSRCN